MTAITAVAGGLVIGYLVKDMRRAYLVWLPMWTIVLIFQTIVLNQTEDDAIDWVYPFVELVILCAGLAAVWVGGYIRRRRSTPAA